MYEIEAWLCEAREKLAKYAETRLEIERLEARAARELAAAVEAYEWPADRPLPDRFDCYGVQNINGRAYGEDLTSELAVLGKCSQGSAEYLVRDIAVLTDNMPQCWDKVTAGLAPLWQARKVVDACQVADMGLGQHQMVDDTMGPALGVLGYKRLSNLLDAAIREADPEQTLRTPKKAATTRRVRVGGNPGDPGTGWISATLDRADTIVYDAHIHYIAEKLAAQGDAGTLDERLATAAAMMCNPAQAIQYIGTVLTTRGMDPAPATEDEKQRFTEMVARMAPVVTPRTQVYLHIHADNVFDPDGLVRFEEDGPALIKEIANVTRGSSVKVTPVVHVGDLDETPVDAYEIPDYIRSRVQLRSPYSCFPWSSKESRKLDLDHTEPWEEGAEGQTRPSNLAPLERRSHRVKTHAGWALRQPKPGVLVWTTGAGQRVLVNHTGSYRIPALE